MPTIDRRELAAIFAGGFLGAIARVGLVELVPLRSPAPSTRARAL
jgi:fluoride ion exporter CrcB/FEX